ncbi:serine protease [Oceanibaculum nanhaiense]|uniref:S1 family peptidase n=1 Tax=Oceanibaculum nanhaiense TaxID=1909734 RepID=UPI00396E1F80
MENDFIQDPEFISLRTDIAAIEINVPGKNISCLNDDDSIFDNSLLSEVGFECSVVGYPNINIEGMITPIWRRATIASEPYLPIDGKPIFLLDASTSPGFSGAPVFRRHIGASPSRGRDGKIAINLDRVLTTLFVGVYAGRFSHKHFGGEIPFVFYGNRLDFIIPDK